MVEAYPRRGNVRWRPLAEYADARPTPDEPAVAGLVAAAHILLRSCREDR